MQEEKQGGSKQFITSSPKLNFFFGLIIGVAVIALIGFGVMALNKGNDQNSSENNSVAGEQQQNASDETPVDLKIESGDYVLGNPDGKIKIFEFTDFQCPYCLVFHDTMHQLIDEYGDDVAWVFKHFPLSSHPLSLPGAMAVECAGEQGKFWEMSDIIFLNQETLAAESFSQFAEELGLDTEQFDTCFAAGPYQDKISSDYNLGIEAGVRGTPTSFIQNQLVPGAIPFDSLKEAVDDLLTQ